MHCDHTVQFSADLSLWLDNLGTTARPPTPSRLSPVPPGREMDIDVQSRRDISRTFADRD